MQSQRKDGCETYARGERQAEHRESAGSPSRLQEIRNPKRDFAASSERVKRLKEQYDYEKACERDSYILEMDSRRFHLFLLGHQLKYFIDELHITLNADVIKQLVCAGFTEHLIHEGLVNLPTGKPKHVYRTKGGRYADCHFVAEYPDGF